MNKNLISALLGALLSVGIFALIYLLLDKTHLEKFLPDTKLESILYIPNLLLAIVSAILIHELGHLLMGLFLGNRLQLFIVAFLGIKAENGKIKFFFNNNISYFGGIAATVPKRTKNINYKTFIKIIVAGPIASLLYAVICALIFFYTDSVFNSFFAVAALTSFGMLAATTIPDKTGLFFTDRKRFQRLHTAGVTRGAEIALYQLISQSFVDGSFKNIDLQKTYIIEKDPEFIMQFWAAYIRFQFYAENEIDNEKEYSHRQLINFKNRLPASLWESLKIE
jgi:hypothetical protein